MTITALSLALSLTAAGARPANTMTPAPQSWPTAAALSAAASGPQRVAQPRWTIDQREKRPAGLTVLYGTFAGLQLADACSTRRAMGAGAIEANPLMRRPARSAGGMYAVKTASSAAAIYFAEKAWKRHRAGAVIMMAALNGATAAVVARNMRNAR